MSSMIRRHSVLTAVVVASIVVPSMVAAQKTPEALERRASAIVNIEHGIGKSAGLLVQAAQMRGAADPVGVTDLTAAANAYYFSGQTARARELCVQAGERALAMGAVDRAAHAFLFAAIVANRQGDVVARDSLLTRANLLASSPLLSRTQRQAILLQSAPATGASVKVATTPAPQKP